MASKQGGLILQRSRAHTGSEMVFNQSIKGASHKVSPPERTISANTGHAATSWNDIEITAGQRLESPMMMWGELTKLLTMCWVTC